MHRNQRRLVLSSILFMPLFFSATSYAAKSIDLDHQSLAILQTLTSSTAQVKSAIGLKEISRNTDLNQTLHIRVQQTYKGYDIFGADAVIHMPNTGKTTSLNKILALSHQEDASMNGTFYQDIDRDLANTPAVVFTQAKAQQALQFAIDSYQHQVGNTIKVQDAKSDLIVFIDQDNKAHWAFKTTFFVEPPRSDVTPAQPVYIIDAISSRIYSQWDNIKTIENAKKITAVVGGGFGGNLKMGKLVYDGLNNNLASLAMTRDDKTRTCQLANSDVVVTKYRSAKLRSKSMSFSCKVTDPNHNNIYWDADFDTVNDGYSPANDALSAGIVIKKMYQEWYGVPVLKNSDGSPMLLEMVVHVPRYENAYWDGSKMTFGDGYRTFYPLTSLGVGAHEISHGFTQQHSNLIYRGESGGMNEAFSDMAAQAAEFFSYKKNSWQIGPEIFKREGAALRYMDKPSKDCGGRTPGSYCSIDDYSQYRPGIDVHYSSGIYNRFFYTLGTTKGWDARKAFDVMVQANANYWTPNSTFAKGACGVIKAAEDLKKNVDDVKKAFDVVKVDYSAC